MPKKLPLGAFHDIRKPENRLATMRRDVNLLRDNDAYTTCTTVVLCYLDALAAGRGKATSGKFEAFVKRHFPELCSELKSVVPGRRSGEKILYDEFRNGFAHLFGPESGYAIGDDRELEGRYADKVEIDGRGTFVAVNADRLISDFLRVVKALQGGAT